MSYRRNTGYHKYKLPKRWESYTKVGKIVPGTNFLPFKTPLKEEICQLHLPDYDWFTPAILLRKVPNLKLVIDLTQTDRYYSYKEFLENGVQYKKIVCPGGGKLLPSRRIIHKFIDTVDSFLRSWKGMDPDALIGVHCTHGLNRTGFLICKYMTERNNISPTEAVKKFEISRGHKMERQLYINNIINIPSTSNYETNIGRHESNATRRRSYRPMRVSYPRGRDFYPFPPSRR